jgi:arylsulfatase A-like enzyme
MGMFDSTGSPLKNGFDHFFGYNCQRHAHSYFPKYLYHNDQQMPLEGNDGKGIGKTYAQDLIANESLRWIRSVKDRPFFLFYAITLPHGRHEIDDLGPYAHQPWTPQQKAYAAQVSRLDADIGRVLTLLKELGLDENTLVITTGDNGSSFAPSSEIGRLFEQASNGLRGYKRSLYEGALRQAAIARWPGTIPANRVASDPWAFWDFLPTAAELADARLPQGFQTDGLSLVAYLKGGNAPKRQGFYWELHEGKPQQAARIGDWKAVKPAPNAPLELFNLAHDSAESNNIASSHPDKVAELTAFMAQSHAPNPDWPLTPTAQKKPLNQ